LLSLLDKAKAYPLFQKDHPDALADVLHVAPNTTNYYDNFKVVIRAVWRFEEEDTLVFRIDLENASNSTIYYKPQDLAVRLEDRIYTQSLADASGVMPPKSTTPAFFAITGNGSGGRNNLAPDNKWNVLVVRVGSEREDGTLSEASGAAGSLSPRWRDLSCFHPAATGAATKAGQHACRQPSHSGEELFLPRGHPAAVPDPGDAVSTGGRQGWARYANAKAVTIHPADHLRDKRTNYQRILSTLWPADSLRAGERSGFHKHRYAESSVRERIGSGWQWFLVFQDRRDFPSSGLYWITRPIQRIRTPGLNPTAPRACEDSS
jgi:hypothetical protein